MALMTTVLAQRNIFGSMDKFRMSLLERLVSSMQTLFLQADSAFTRNLHAFVVGYVFEDACSYPDFLQLLRAYLSFLQQSDGRTVLKLSLNYRTGGLSLIHVVLRGFVMVGQTGVAATWAQ